MLRSRSELDIFKEGEGEEGEEESVEFITRYRFV